MLYQRENELALNTNGNRFNTIFAVCFKILDKPLKGILCNKCSSFINRKCSTWKTSEIRKKRGIAFLISRRNFHSKKWVTLNYKRKHSCYKKLGSRAFWAQKIALKKSMKFTLLIVYLCWNIVNFNKFYKFFNCNFWVQNVLLSTFLILLTCSKLSYQLFIFRKLNFTLL